MSPQRRVRVTAACHMHAAPEGLLETDLLFHAYFNAKLRYDMNAVVAHIMIC